MPTTLLQSDLPGLPLRHRGKVRDVFDIPRERLPAGTPPGDYLLMVATDRLSAFDVVLPDPIPGKGEMLCQVSNFWFAKTAHLMPNHLTGIDVASVLPEGVDPALYAKRAVVTRKLKPVDVSKVHFRLGDALQLPWLFEQVDALEVNGRWHAVARGVLRDELAANHRNLAGQVLGQLSNICAAAHIRAGRLVPVLLAHVSEHIGLHVYYGSRDALPRRVRAFIDLAVQRLQDCPDYLLTMEELERAAQPGWAVTTTACASPWRCWPNWPSRRPWTTRPFRSQSSAWASWRHTARK